MTTEWAAIDGIRSPTEVGPEPSTAEVLELYASGEKADRVARLTGLRRRLTTTSSASGEICGCRTTAPTKTDLY